MSMFQLVDQYTDRVVDRCRSEFPKDILYAAVVGNLESLLIEALNKMDEETRTQFIKNMMSRVA